MEDKVRENRLRRMADRRGLILRKSRRFDPRASDYGLYALWDARTGGLIHLDNVNSVYALTLDEVEDWLMNEESKERSLTIDFGLALDVIENLDEWANKLAAPVLPPIENPAANRLEFRQHIPHTVMIGKCVRVVSGVHASLALADLGYVTECAAIMRTVSDFCNEINAIGKALDSKEDLPEPVQEFVQHYFAPKPRTPDQHKKTKGLRYPSRRDLMNVEKRWAESKGIDHEETRSLQKFLNRGSDDYVHGAYETTMELYDMREGHFSMRGSRLRWKRQDYIEWIFLKLHEVVSALEITAAVTSHEEVWNATRGARRALDRAGWSSAPLSGA